MFFPSLRNLNIIFTVSPVRHIRDGLVENNLSKAILIESVHEIVNQFENVEYFPSYEIIMDELRDYRFFKNDMVHPTSQAIDYVWDKFSEIYFDDETKKFIHDWDKITLAMKHNAAQPKSNQHQQFLKSTITNLIDLKDKVNISEELKILQNKII